MLNWQRSSVLSYVHIKSPFSIGDRLIATTKYSNPQLVFVVHGRSILCDLFNSSVLGKNSPPVYRTQNTTTERLTDCTGNEDAEGECWARIQSSTWSSRVRSETKEETNLSLFWLKIRAYTHLTDGSSSRYNGMPVWRTELFREIFCGLLRILSSNSSTTPGRRGMRL